MIDRMLSSLTAGGFADEGLAWYLILAIVVGSMLGLIIIIFAGFGVASIARGTPNEEEQYPETSMKRLVRRLMGPNTPRVEKPIKVIQVDLTRPYDYFPVPA